MDKDILITILKKANFSNEFIQYIEHHFPSHYQRITPSPFVDDYLKNPLLQLNPKNRMIESIAQLIHLRNRYKRKGIPLSYLYPSIYDLNYRIERYFKKHHVYGLSKRDIRWITPIFRAEIFDIGPLRFQMSYFSFAEIERSGHEYMHLSPKWKQAIPEGTPIITIHIMKNANITPEKVTKSFQEAVLFFERYFPAHDYELFVCRTWLLYEPLQELLGAHSNIVSFAKRFTIIAQNKNTKQALERIYGTSHLEQINQMEKTSRLQKKAYKKLHLIGEAAGIIHKLSIDLDNK